MFSQILLFIACGAPPPAAQDTDESQTDDSYRRAEDSEDSPDSDPGDTETEDLAPERPVWTGRFVDVSAPWLTPGVIPVHPGTLGGDVPPEDAVAVPADLDGDGTLDLLVGTFSIYAEHGSSTIQAFRWDGLGWVDAPDLRERLPDNLYKSPYSVVDVDADGWNDLIFSSREGFVSWGGAEGFAPATAISPLNERQWMFETAISLWDLDQDGWLDVLAGESDCVQTLVPYLRTGSRAFTPHPEWYPPGGAARPEATFVWPRPDGTTAVLMAGNACDFANAPTGVFEVSPTGFTAVDPFVHPAFWDLHPPFDGAAITELSPRAMAAGDLDGDGLLDLVLTLGNLHQVQLLRADTTGALIDQTTTAPGDDWQFTPDLAPQLYWSVVLPDLDLDGRPDMVTAIGADAQSGRVAGGFAMASEVRWNGGGWALFDVTTDVGLDPVGSWHGLLLADVDADGDADLSMGGYGSVPRFLRNDLDAGHHGLSLTLRGSTSNHLGMGAIVTVTRADGSTQTSLHGDTGSPQGMIRPTTWIGVGDETEARVHVRWPSGTEQDATLATGRAHELAEPAVWQVLDDDRHAQANGAGVVVRITPRRPDGSVDGAVHIDVTASGASVTITTDAELPGGGRDVRVTPTGEPGVTRLQVVLDGQTLPLGPQLWWDLPR